uniref:LRRNT domain-containing protein n=1 Tax=Cyprinus carpio TaxID=7962 RepID=A0A8C1GZ89_CYPCA
MSASSSVLGVAVLLLHLWGTHSFPTSACPVPCLCQHGPLLNCSSLGLTEIPTHIPATAVSLNLSNNALRSLGSLSFGHVKLKGLLHLWVGSNCDCNLQALRRWISFDTEMGDTSWQVVCASPPHHGGKDLLHLKDSELTCPTNEYNNQPKLLIKDITEQHAGLYICISGLQGEHISVFDLHVYKKGSGSRPRREAATMLDKQENMNTPRNDPVVRERSQSEFI